MEQRRIYSAVCALDIALGLMNMKRFKLSAHQIKPLAEGLGGCIATDMITVNGSLVGYMVREPSDRPDDSGWCFMAGNES